MDYTICSNVIAIAKDANRYSFDLLFQFTSANNPHRVVINGKILEEYEPYKNELIRTWLDGLSKQNFYKIIETELINNIFIDTCRQSRDCKLIVNEKDDYSMNEIEGLNVLNKDEAIEEIKPKLIQITQIGIGNKASTGDYSNL
ncbi:MAG: hypothetical protein N4A41_04160 [Crocinitomicaceae bacterium]|jgi:hypothetical protein|nr:hypothetical protein [Crocinitomicaceae bacterium]